MNERQTPTEIVEAVFRNTAIIEYSDRLFEELIRLFQVERDVQAEERSVLIKQIQLRDTEIEGLRRCLTPPSDQAIANAAVKAKAIAGIDVESFVEGVGFMIQHQKGYLK